MGIVFAASSSCLRSHYGYSYKMEEGSAVGEYEKTHTDQILAVTIGPSFQSVGWSALRFHVEMENVGKEELTVENVSLVYEDTIHKGKSVDKRKVKLILAPGASKSIDLNFDTETKEIRYLVEIVYVYGGENRKMRFHLFRS